MNNTNKSIPYYPNWISGAETPAISQETLTKFSPHSGTKISTFARSTSSDAERAINAASSAQPEWAAIPGVERGNILHHACNLLEEHKNEIAQLVSEETGKSLNDALGETGGAIALGRFFAGEGQRLYGRTTTTGQVNKSAMTVRQPCGVAGLIIAGNTPIANIAWKSFPALICGNGVILKAADDCPGVAWLFTKIMHLAGLPKGIFNVLHGYGEEVGRAIVHSPKVDVISFTGSSAVGREIAAVAGQRLAKVSLELGGKNPLVVCDDCDLDNAVKWVCLSVFSNAGQRCAAASRVIVFEKVYDEFKKRLLEEVAKMRLGPRNDDTFGPVINQKQLNNMIAVVDRAVKAGGDLLTGGHRLLTPEHSEGYYMAPTVLDNLGAEDEITGHEIFGPVAQLYKVNGYHEALAQANSSPYGLTACIHTKSWDRAWHFTQNVRAGVAVVNAGTFGSEPHMPFGGFGLSGNGSREPGTEALDVYSELKDIYLNIDTEKL